MSDLQQHLPNIFSLCQISATNLDALLFHTENKIPFCLIKADFESSAAAGCVTLFRSVRLYEVL